MFSMTGSTLSWNSVTYPKHPVLYKSQKATEDDNIQQKAHQGTFFRENHPNHNKTGTQTARVYLLIQLIKSETL